MAKPPTKAQLDEAARLQAYLDCIAKYEREFKKWEERNRKIIKRYRDEGRSEQRTDGASKFNILWSNVQILVPATFARIPQPDVSRRFRDQDPVGRVAALILERALEFEVQHYPDYRDTMTQDVHDRFLGGRGTAWIRYEPHFRAAKGETAPEAQVTEDVEALEPEEELDYECAPVDYVHWKDFGHSVARTWEEVTQVWRKVYMSEAAVEERFGAEIAKEIPYDSTPEDLKRADRNAQTDNKQQACVFELWDKERAVAVWFSKSMKKFLDEKPDPLKLHQFFPCPKPLYATMTNDTLVPVPDYTLYQDQAIALDTLSDRIAGLVNMLQLKGVYDASADAALGRLFTEGANGNLIPVKNWAAFAEKNGLKGQIDVYDLTPIAKALESAYVAAEQIKMQIYEVMGISDIVRGASDPNETLGAQELKGQYASMRLRAMQADVARYATDILALKAQVMCSKFAPQTLVAISAAEQLSPHDRQVVPQALALLVGEARLMDPQAEAPNPLRAFRIEVAADSMIQMNEAEEKKDRMEFLAANAQFMEKAVKLGAEAGAAAPAIVPLVMEMWKFGVTGFKVGKTIEGQFDEATEKLKALAAQPQAKPPDPEMVKAQAESAARAAELKHEQQKAAQEAQLKAAEAQATAQREAAAAQAEHQRELMRLQAEDQQAQREDAFKRWQVEEDNRTKIEVAEIAAQASLDSAQMKQAEDAVDGKPAAGGEAKPKRKGPIDKLADMHKETLAAHGTANEQMAAALRAMAETLAKPRRLVRNPQTGRAEGVETVG